MNGAEERDIVIVGGGICGLATALALQRKGIRSLVLERSKCLHATGVAMTIGANGWHALDHLGLGSLLRKDSVQILGKGEARCIKRSDLVEALAKDLPQGIVRFGCNVISVKLDLVTSYAVLELHIGIVIKAEVLIGCGGANSVVLKCLRMNPTKFSATSATRGFTSYPEDLEISKNQEIKMSILETIQDFPEEMKEMIKNSDPSSLSCLRFRYRDSWDLMLESFRKGTITAAGDALHAMIHRPMRLGESRRCDSHSKMSSTENFGI